MPEQKPVQTDHHREKVSSLAPLDDCEFFDLLEHYPIGQSVGLFQRTPWRLDFNWFLRPGADPRPLSPLDLARIKHSIQTAGAVMVFATEQTALDIALHAIDAEFPELEVVN